MTAGSAADESRERVEVPVAFANADTQDQQGGEMCGRTITVMHQRALAKDCGRCLPCRCKYQMTTPTVVYDVETLARTSVTNRDTPLFLMLPYGVRYQPE